MSLQTHKSRRRPGTVDWVFFALSALVVVGLSAAALAGLGQPWQSTRGRVESAQIYEPAATVLKPSQLVRVEYSYPVQGVTHRGSWDGSWPRSFSPNALAGHELAQLTQPGFSLFVWYDPDDPGQSALHGDGTWGAALVRWMILVAALALWLAMVWVYPRVKSRMPVHSTA